MVPTTCSGRSDSTAARSRAPALSARSGMRLILSTDAYHGAPGDAPGDVGRKGLRQLREVDGAGDDARELPGLQVRRDALPHGEAPFAAGGRGVDAEQRHAAQDEGHHRGLELGARGEPDAGDVAPEIHGAREPGEDLAP